MKKYIIAVCIILLLAIAADFAYFRLGVFIETDSTEPVTTFVQAKDKQIYIDRGEGMEPFEIRGVNMGSGLPGEWSTDFAITEATYLRWFGYIKEMGANTLRIYTVQSDAFYNAFYSFNADNPNPLYLIQGVWVNDYIQNSHRDAYDKDFFDAFAKDCKIAVDVVHGNKKIAPDDMDSAGSGTYRKDVSPWVIGYILGVEWEDVTVVYTDNKYMGDAEHTGFKGRYLETSPDATPFESMLAMVGDSTIAYESSRYHEQRLIAFSNWPTTDPFDYPLYLEAFFMKCAKVDVEHIVKTDEFKAGQFASYHVYPYYPDYLSFVHDWSSYGIEERSAFADENGTTNTYRAYLSMLTKHHTMPVVISEFGVSTGRGMAQRDQNTGRNQGGMSEQGQGQALIDCYKDIISAGCAGGCVFSWQDEWFKRTWNTMYAVDLRRTPYWSDYQTNEQYFGLLSFDPGKNSCVCYVDGDIAEWEQTDRVFENNNGSLSLKYDEKFIYLLIHRKDYAKTGETLFIPINTTPKSGSNYCQNFDLRFDRDCDFLIVIDGSNNSRVMVQQRYEALRANYSSEVYGYNTYVLNNIPDKDSPVFVNIDMILQTATPLIYNDKNAPAETFESGKLTHGNANPNSNDYNSLADFMIKGDYIELKLPWQLLNFADPSRMQIHDDYYNGNYGVEYIGIESIHLALMDGSDENRAVLSEARLKGWGNRVTAHERLKPSYYMLKDYWNGSDPK